MPNFKAIGHKTTAPGKFNICMSQNCHILLNRREYGSKLRLLFTDTDGLVYKIETKMFMTILVAIKKCLILATILLNQNLAIIQMN